MFSLPAEIDARFQQQRVIFHSSTPSKNANIPVVTIADFEQEHAREVITSELAVWLSKVLIGDDAQVLSWPQLQRAMADVGVSKEQAVATMDEWRRYILKHLQVQILPVQNVDGRQLLEQGDLCRRTTASGVDLNRNWPFAWHNESVGSEMYGGTRPLSEVPSQVLFKLAQDRPPKAFVNVHSGEWALYTPWDSRMALAPNLPADLPALVDQLASLCGCMAGPAGAVSGYLAFGTSMDYMFKELRVPYSLTLELYGSDLQGKLKPGQRNNPLQSFLVETSRRQTRRLMGEPALQDELLKLVARSSKARQQCFAMYNPINEEDYKEVIGRWLVALMLLLRHVADPAHPLAATTAAAAVG